MTLTYSRFVFSAEAYPPSATEVEKVKAELEARVWESRSKEEWTPPGQNDFKEFQAQSAALLLENERLSREYQSLQDETAQLHKDIHQAQDKIKALHVAIDDQKKQMDEKLIKQRTLAKEQEWQAKLDQKNKDLEEANRANASLEQKIALGKLKLQTMGVVDNPEEAKGMREEITLLQARIEEQKTQESGLQEKIAQFKAAEEKIDPEVLQLRNSIDALEKQIADTTKLIQSQENSKVPDHHQEIEELSNKKVQLETRISEIKDRIAKIDQSKKMGIVNPRMKELVATMSTVDDENEALREEAGYLKENIDILKSHVKKLQYQVESINAMKGQMGARANDLKPAF